MKQLFISLMLLFAVSAQASTSDLLKQVEKTRKVHAFNSKISTVEYKLPNGLTVFLTENPQAPNVIVSHWVNAGSLHEAPGTTGIAHLFEHMMFRPLAPGEPSYFELASKLGGETNANTRFESTYYHTAVPTENLNKILKYDADRFQKLVVTKELLDVERKAVWSEYSTKFDANPTIDLWFQIYQQAFKGHPFGWMIIGFREDLEKITAEDSNRFFQKYYRPNNIGLFITGRFKSKETLKEVVKLYGGWKAGEESKLPAAYSEKTKEIIAEGKLPSQANMFLFGFRTPYQEKESAKIQTFANYILFDSNNGLLKRRMVDDKKIAAEISDFNFDYDNGMMKAAIVAYPKTKLSEIRSEVAQIRNDFEAMSPEEFETYKKNLYIRFGEAAQRNSNLNDLLALSWGKHKDLGLASLFAAKPVDISKQQVQQFLSQYYVPENFIYMAHKGQGK